MLLRTVVSALIYFITLMPFIIIFFVNKTNNKRFRKLLIYFSVIYALHYLLIPYLCDAWRIPIDSRILLLYGSIIIGIILYIILIAVNLYKFDKCLVYELEKKHVVIFICLIIMPSFVLCVTYLAQKVRLANSDLIVVYDSNGNGGLFDGDIFAFAINDDKCFRFDLGIDSWGGYLEEYLPDKFEEVHIDYNSNSLIIDQYIVPYYGSGSSDDFLIMKDNEVVCSLELPGYYNNSLKNIYK